MENSPKLWKIPKAKPSDNKYTRGYVVVSGGGIEMSGAARLAAESTLRVGAGYVKIACPAEALVVYARRLTSVMVKALSGIADFKKLVSDKRVNVIVIGPGHGVNRRTKDFVLAALKSGKDLVLDADALTSFEKRPEELFKAIKAAKGQVVLTPHEGEFKRLFALGKDKEKSVQAAAKNSGAVVLLKGSNTIIASPDGRIIINKNAPANLATAGTGDVLTGIIAGLMAQKMNALSAAAAGVYIHAAAAKLFGHGLISEDLPWLIPQVLKELD